MSLACLTLGLLAAPPTQAQQDYGHHWIITYSQTGTYSYVVIDGYGNRTPQNGQWDTLTAPNNTSGGGDTHGYHFVSDITDGNVTATLKWMPANGYTQATDPPPSKVYINEYAKASWAASWGAPGSPSASDYAGASANDGLGDAEVNGVSTGDHLIQRDGSSGTITLPPVTLHASSPTSVNVTSGYPGGGSGGGYPGGGGSGYWTWSGGAKIVTNFSVSVDTRAVTISSSLGQTYHRELDASQKPIQVADTPSTDGTMRATTLGQNATISYFVHAYGNWTNGSRYSLHCSSGDPSGSNYANGDQPTVTGQFSLPSDPICFLTMHYGSSPTPEHAYAHLTDFGDGADGTANGYVTFHTNYEDWHKDPSKTIAHPLPLKSNGVVNASGDWNYMFIIDNTTPSPITQNLKNDVTIKKTMQGTIGGQVSGPIEAATFQANESITIGSETSKTFSVDTTFTGHAFTRTLFYTGQSWEERAGTCTVWGTSGYKNDAVWNGVYAPNPAVASPGSDTTTYYPGYKP